MKGIYLSRHPVSACDCNLAESNPVMCGVRLGVRKVVWSPAHQTVPPSILLAQAMHCFSTISLFSYLTLPVGWRLAASGQGRLPTHLIPSPHLLSHTSSLHPSHCTSSPHSPHSPSSHPHSPPPLSHVGEASMSSLPAKQPSIAVQPADSTVHHAEVSTAAVSSSEQATTSAQ